MFEKKEKDEAQRKLERTQENLLRIKDILFEKDKQQAVLKRSVKKFEKYSVLKEELNDLKRKSIGLKYSRCKYELEQLNKVKNPFILEKSNLLSEISKLNSEITQIENRRFLADGTLDVYFLPRNEGGRPQVLTENVEPELFVVDGEKRIPQRILSLEQDAPRRQGISFLLLIDNSGSMHDEYLGNMLRFETARFAVEQFLQDIDNPLDRIGLSAFNTFYTPLMPVSQVSARFENALNSIQRPAREHSYTELYRSIREAAGDLADYRGRRAIIVLSDGENFPYTLSGNPHPLYGNQEFNPQDALKTLLDEGISLYAVHIGEKQDKPLDDIAKRSGGRSFTADDRGNLMNI